MTKIKSRTDRIFDTFVAVVMCAVMIVTLAPFWFSIVGSFNDGLDYSRGGVYFWPREFTWSNYQAVFVDTSIYQAYFITIARTLLGTIGSVLFTGITAYAMSRKNLKFKGVYMVIMLITMFFSGGLIPTYLLYRDLHLLDTFWVYIIPTLFSVWNMIIMMSFFRGIPDTLIESAKIDGAGEYRIFFQLILPLSKPVLAAIALFNGVAHWNTYFDSMMFTNSPSLQTIQLFLMRVVTDADFARSVGGAAAANIPEQAKKISPETLKLAMMIATSLPIIIVYPFLQKYFVKGVLIGSIKG